ncbi:unnamed protein product [Closterium sp. NIES-53]
MIYRSLATLLPATISPVFSCRLRPSASPSAIDLAKLLRLSFARDVLLLKECCLPNLLVVSAAIGAVPPHLFYGCAAPRLPTLTASLATAVLSSSEENSSVSIASGQKQGNRGRGGGKGGGGSGAGDGGGAGGRGGGDGSSASSGGDTGGGTGLAAPPRGGTGPVAWYTI